MKKMMYSISALVLTAGLAFGQSTNTAAGSQNSLTGCLGGSSGNFTLTSGGTQYKLTGDTSKLDQHIGHQVQLNGTTGSDSSTFNVSGDAKMIADKCDNSGAASSSSMPQ